MSTAMSLTTTTTSSPLLRHRVITKLDQKTPDDDPVAVKQNVSRTPQKGKMDTWLLMTVPAVFTAAYAVNFLLDIYRVGDNDYIERILANPFSIIHIMASITSMAVGPIQFLKSVRQKRMWVHRWVGRLYVASIVVGGIYAFVVSFMSLCRPIGQVLFAALATAWLGTVAMGMRTIWQGKVNEHRRWMTRNFSLTYAAVMLRWQLPLLMAMGMETEPALSLTGFTCWVPNLVFIEWYME